MAPDKGGMKEPAFHGVQEDRWQCEGADAALPRHLRPPVRWQTAELLLQLPAVQQLLQQVRPVHENLKRDNWIYLLLFVYVATLYKVLVMFVTFPIVNLQIARVADGWLAHGLHVLLELCPAMESPFQAGGHQLVLVSRLLHPCPDRGLIASVASRLLLLFAKMATASLMMVSFAMNVWAGLFLAIRRFLNDDRCMTAVPVDEVPLLFLKKTAGLFWRLPFNIVYDWLASPLVVQPAEWAVAVAERLQMLVSGSLQTDCWPGGGRADPAGQLPAGPPPAAAGAEYRAPAVLSFKSFGSADLDDSLEVQKTRINSFSAPDSPSVKDLVFRFEDPAATPPRQDAAAGDK